MVYIECYLLVTMNNTSYPVKFPIVPSYRQVFRLSTKTVFAFPVSQWLVKTAHTILYGGGTAQDFNLFPFSCISSCNLFDLLTCLITHYIPILSKIQLNFLQESGQGRSSDIEKLDPLLAKQTFLFSSLSIFKKLIDKKVYIFYTVNIIYIQYSHTIHSCVEGGLSWEL